MNEPTSLAEKAMSRPPCPFYGFYKWDAGKSFKDQKGNQCPLRKGYAPCLFEGTEEKPSWKECPINRENPGLLETFSEYTVLAEEFAQGIPFKNWVEYTL